MSRDTWSDEQLAELAALPADHPEVRAVAADPERMARLVALREFLHAPEAPAGARTDEARVRLRSVVRDALSGAGAAGAGSVSGAGPSRLAEIRAQPRRGRRGWWFGGWQPALAAAAVLLVTVVFIYPRFRERESVTRGTETAMVETLAPLVTTEQVVLRWRQVPGAERYEVRLLREDLSPARSVIATSDSTLQLPANELFPKEGGPAAAFWRVSALRRGSLVAQSELIALEPPPGRRDPRNGN